MDSLFERETTESVISRLQQLQPGTAARWGKMDVAQMLAHCRAPLELYFTEAKLRRGLVGILFGKMAKRRLFSNKPWPQNLPTAPSYRIKGKKDFDTERRLLIESINRFASEGTTITQKAHPILGKMSSLEWGMLGYRHLHHHLEQFGV